MLGPCTACIRIHGPAIKINKAVENSLARVAYIFEQPVGSVVQFRSYRFLTLHFSTKLTMTKFQEWLPKSSAAMFFITIMLIVTALVAWSATSVVIARPMPENVMCSSHALYTLKATHPKFGAYAGFD